MASKIIIISSNSEERIANTTLLKKAGFDALHFADVNADTVNAIHKINPDIILLDLEIDGSDGIEFCLEFKTEGVLSSYVVIYSDQEADYIQLEAFKAGADDYIVKPINLRLLVKKLNALLKRKPANESTKAKILTYNSLKIDRESYLVIKDGQKISVPKKEFEMLYLFINTPQKVFSRKEIFERLWENTEGRNTRIIDVHIRKIRERVGQNIIKTIKGVGYQLA